MLDLGGSATDVREFNIRCRSGGGDNEGSRLASICNNKRRGVRKGREQAEATMMESEIGYNWRCEVLNMGRRWSVRRARRLEDVG